MKENISLSRTPFNDTKSLSPAADSQGIFLTRSEGFCAFQCHVTLQEIAQTAYLRVHATVDETIVYNTNNTINISHIENEIKSSKALQVNKSGNSNVNLLGYVMTVTIQYIIFTHSYSGDNAGQETKQTLFQTIIGSLLFPCCPPLPG